MKYLLGLDQGPSGTKAYLMDFDGNRAGLGYVPTELIRLRPDWIEQDPRAVAVGAAQAIKQALHAALKVQASCDDNNFRNNNFYSNSFDVATNGTMVLNTFSHNYWDKYDGYDRSRDGIGDVAYRPDSMYSMIVEQNPTTLILLRRVLITFLDKAEKAIPSLTPENLIDENPLLSPNAL